MCHYVVFDLEMCRVSKHFPLTQEIIQIGAIKLDDQFQIVDSFKTFVKPELGTVDSFISKLTGIRNADLVHAPVLTDALILFLAWLDEDTTLITWSDNDERQIQKELSYKNIIIPEMVEYFGCIEDCQQLFNDMMSSNKNYSLAEALRISDIEMEVGEHDALVDAKNTAKIYKKMMCEEEYTLNHYYVESQKEEHLTYNPFAEFFANMRLEF